MTHFTLPQRLPMFDVHAVRQAAVATAAISALSVAAVTGAVLGTAARAALPSAHTTHAAAATRVAPAPGTIAAPLVRTDMRSDGPFAATAYVHGVDHSVLLVSLSGGTTRLDLLGTKVRGLFTGAVDLGALEGAVLMLRGSCGGSAGCVVHEVQVLRTGSAEAAPISISDAAQAAAHIQASMRAA